MPASVWPSTRALPKLTGVNSLSKMKWTPAAAADLEHVSSYLKERHPHYRQPTLRKLYATIRSLIESPLRGRLGREDGTRELLFLQTPYIAVYTA